MILICLGTFLTFNQEYIRPIAQLLRPGGLPTNKPAASAEKARETLKIVAPDGATKTELNIEIADEDAKRSKGLGYRQSLATNSGMLFLHDESRQYTYWMKGMQFPIDIMWIQDDTILNITEKAMPPVEGQSDDTLVRYPSQVNVNRVLETNAGFVSEYNIQKGDKIVLE